MPATPQDPDGSMGLLLCRDLIFTSKVTGTAQALGCRVVVAGRSDAVRENLGRWTPAVVMLDLSASDLTSREEIASYRQLAPETPFLAFGSHVDLKALADAAAAGCDPVVARSRFTSELPAIIQKYLGKPKI